MWFFQSSCQTLSRFCIANCNPKNFLDSDRKNSVQLRLRQDWRFVYYFMHIYVRFTQPFQPWEVEHHSEVLQTLQRLNCNFLKAIILSSWHFPSSIITDIVRSFYIGLITVFCIVFTCILNIYCCQYSQLFQCNISVHLSFTQFLHVSCCKNDHNLYTVLIATFACNLLQWKIACSGSLYIQPRCRYLHAVPLHFQCNYLQCGYCLISFQGEVSTLSPQTRSIAT